MYYTLITGASRGIGEALARRCAQEGQHLILVARSQDRLETLADELRHTYPITVQVVPLDLLLPEASARLWQTCQANRWSVRVLINNAGFGHWGEYAITPLTEQTNIMRLNATVPIELCHLFMPTLRAEPNAHILNVGSISSYQPVPYFSMYSATKALLLSFSRSLRIEVQPLDINVTCLCPGFTQSYFFDRAGTAPLVSSPRFQMTTEKVADAAVRGMQKNRAVVVPGALFKLCTYASRYLPVSLTAYVLSKVLKPSAPSRAN